MNRSEFIKSSILTAAGTSMFGCSAYKRYLFESTDDSWSSGVVRHILPGVSHDRFLIKVSFCRVVQSPSIRIGDWQYDGVRTDGFGEFWSFDIAFA